MRTKSGVVGIFEKNANEQIRGEFKVVRGLLCFDLRVFERLPSSSVHVPTKKGICVRLDKVPKLKDLLDTAVRLGADGNPDPRGRRK